MPPYIRLSYRIYGAITKGPSISLKGHQRTKPTPLAKAQSLTEGGRMQFDPAVPPRVDLGSMRMPPYIRLSYRIYGAISKRPSTNAPSQRLSRKLKAWLNEDESNADGSSFNTKDRYRKLTMPPYIRLSYRIYGAITKGPSISLKGHQRTKPTPLAKAQSLTEGGRMQFDPAVPPRVDLGSMRMPPYIRLSYRIYGAISKRPSTSLKGHQRNGIKILKLAMQTST